LGSGGHRQHPARAERATAAPDSHFAGFLVLFVVAFADVTVTAQPGA
jgi:hypothetical protein